MVKLPDWPWRLAFDIGVMVGPVICMAVTGEQIERQTVLVDPLVYVAAFLVGLATAAGSGCTSGHGICGLSRLSLRSFVAVMAFMVSAVITVVLVQSLA